ncbi:serine protease [Phreatobacter stygius]|uniref:Trypsin-like serine protease n=1 Tax=Phreatobacter stygius TaxID=1940610 RepID=A0A4D7BGE4_9HYPH|nr:serine protease [Phreatobacter stygius]QCI66857.1 trypsin-like serine protease [Phreatobacter stygius]
MFGRVVRYLLLVVATAALGQVPAQAQQDLLRFYGRLDLGVRVGLQRSLIWVNTFPAIADGNISPRTITAIREYQRRLGRPETGLLRPDELDRLLADAARVRGGVGYRTLRDNATGTMIGLPSALISSAEPVRRGTRFRSPAGDIDLVTMNVPTGERSLQQHYEMTLRSRPPAHYKVFRGNWFVIAGSEQSGRSYYVRMHDSGSSLRGFAISYDPALTSILGPVVSAMSSDFKPYADGPSVAEAQSDLASLRGSMAALPSPPSQNLQPLPPVDAPSPAPAAAPAGVGGPSEPIRESISTGTGFLVSAQGHFLTNAHVVSNCSAIGIGVFGAARLIDADQTNDLALLKVEARVPASPISFAARSPAIGEEIIALGFPLQDILGNGINMTRGDVSALAGIGGDSRFIQITAAVQQGNSGGPLLDRSGRLVGVVTSKLNATRVAQVSGDIPQSVNFAIRSELAELFLRRHGLSASLAANDAPRREPVEIVASTQEAVQQVACIKR